MMQQHRRTLLLVGFALILAAGIWIVHTLWAMYP
jgi:hypothetical protein